MILTGENKAYSIMAEGQVAILLSNFDTNFIIDSTEDMIVKAREYYSTEPTVNYVSSLEIAFKDMLNQYPSDKNNIIEVRNKTYDEIIETICNKSGLRVIYDTSSVDLFTLSKYLFDLTVSNYHINVFDFLYNFIVTQKDFIYSNLNLDSMKKSKDTSTVYNRQLYSDNKLAIINANLEYCLKFITSMDFSIEQILNYMYYNKEYYVAKYLNNYIDPSINLYDILINPMISNPYTYGPLVTSVKLEIQKNNIIGKSKYIPSN